MLVKTIRKPGEPGTHNLLKRFGERLVCVRYRYDQIRHKRYKTAEIIVAEEDWLPPPDPELSAEPQKPQQHRVGIRIDYHERELRQKISAVGGTWSQRERLWRVTPEVVERLGLQNRVVRG
jgi:hypothetical protein